MPDSIAVKRFQNDVKFHNLVMWIFKMLNDLEFNYTDITNAVELAWYKFNNQQDIEIW